MSGLARRVLTAAVLIPLVSAAVLLLPTFLFAVAIGFMVLLGAWEWAALSALHSSMKRVAYVGFIGVLLGVCGYLVSNAGGVGDRTWVWVVGAGLGWWVVALASVFAYERESSLAWLVPTGTRAAAGVLTLVPAWTGLVWLHGTDEVGPQGVLYLLVLIWVADSAAYFAGRRWGRHRLAPRVSPGKTWEGVAGAVVAAGIMAGISAALVGVSPALVLAFLGLCLMTVCISILGDLAESLFKRVAGTKDSGTIFPGHGGVMDRIDSLTAAAPLFALGMFWIQSGQ
ncbi:MAG: phosphatidate cytidylyltransferase [Gammaproteobacteria bacterium]|nr:MAG: phosphatidate cytidylyltransferase [Gammaproteobacteria bacterium]